MSKIWQKCVVWLITMIQKYAPHNVRTVNCQFITSKEVFNPKYYLTSKFMAENLEIKPKNEVLDIGTGSGVLAIIAAKKAKKVVAIDINQEAIKYAQKNARINGVENNTTFLHSDLFSSLNPKDKFDVIIFNPPYLEGRPKNEFEKALYDPDKKIIIGFFKQAKNFLKPGGYLQVLYSSMAEPEKFLQAAHDYNWHETIIAQKKFLAEEFTIYRFIS